MILIKHFDKGDLNPAFYWALEYYVLESLIARSDDVYFFTWPVFGVISGKNQVIENEVNFKYVKANHIPYYRRPSGGGTVYADQNNLMFTIAKKRSKDFSFKKELEMIVESLQRFGIPAEFSGRNDITIDGKKISGNSFLQTKDGMIIHGTFLFDTNLEKMVKSITPDDDKLVSKGIESVRSRVTNIKDYVSKTLDQFRTFIESDLCSKTYTLSDAEIKMLNEKKEAFLTSEWIHKEQPLHTKVIKKRFEFGLVELKLDISYGRIKNVYFTGDFFESKNIKHLEENLKDLPLKKELIHEALTLKEAASYFVGGTIEALEELFFEAIIGE